MQLNTNQPPSFSVPVCDHIMAIQNEKRVAWLKVHKRNKWTTERIARETDAQSMSEEPRDGVVADNHSETNTI